MEVPEKPEKNDELPHSSTTMTSPFLTPSSTTTDNQLAMLFVRRDQSLPTILHRHPPADTPTGYAEGVVTNTRFGSFPHSTLLDIPWGSQVRASTVDTGSRGRQRKAYHPAPHSDLDQGALLSPGKKRKAAALDELAGNGVGSASFSPALKTAVPAATGFIHVLPPTPELWTTSLPHRTQVVYTPDYSYILHRLRARPGSVLIEAGSGSGSFTHAAARSVFSGYEGERRGRVYSFEFHAQRFAKMRQELAAHGLEAVVRVVERDVYKDGFGIPDDPIPKPDHNTSNFDNDVDRNPNIASPNLKPQQSSPLATAIFLDLPSPWLALRHLSRHPVSPSSPSPLSPSHPIHLCSFSPCIEQVQRTTSTLRRQNWINIETVTISARRIDIRREYTGLGFAGVKGAHIVASTVEEAVERLGDVQARERGWRERQRLKGIGGKGIGAAAAAAAPSLANQEDGNQNEQDKNEDEDQGEPPTVLPTPSTMEGEEEKEEEDAPAENAKHGPIPLFRQGRIIARPEPDLKTHTAYLVFAVLPIEWTEADEARAREKWGGTVVVVDDDGAAETGVGKGRRAEKRERKKAKEKQEGEEEEKQEKGDEQGEGDKMVE